MSTEVYTFALDQQDGPHMEPVPTPWELLNQRPEFFVSDLSPCFFSPSSSSSSPASDEEEGVMPMCDEEQEREAVLGPDPWLEGEVVLGPDSWLEYVCLESSSSPAGDDDDDCVVVLTPSHSRGARVGGRVRPRSRAQLWQMRRETAREAQRITLAWEEVAAFDNHIFDMYSGEMDVLHPSSYTGFFGSLAEYASASEAQRSAYAAVLLAAPTSAQWMTYAAWSSPSPLRGGGGEGEAPLPKRARTVIDLTVE